jgi:5-formyltetrahydrofolate cyclo-ligase
MTNDSIRSDKEALRARVLATREGLELDRVEVGGQAILERILGLEEYRRASLIHTYISSKENEIDTRELIHLSLTQGKRVAVPVLVKGKRTMRHALIEGLDGLVAGPWGLVQPDKADWLEDEAAIDLVVVPGIAFDRRGHRIGLGGGYYDRFLATVETVKVGLCYDDLVLNQIPNEPHDVPMDIVVAETATYIGGAP